MILLVSLTTMKAIDCEVLTTVGKDHKRMIFFPQKAKTSTRSNLFSTFDCSLDDAEILRTHRWHRYFKPVSHSACFSGCRMHQEVLICATVIAPDHPQFWKKKKKEKSPDDPQVNLLIHQECSAIIKSSTTDPKYWCQNMISGREKENLDSKKFHIWVIFKEPTNLHIVSYGAILEKAVVQL